MHIKVEITFSGTICMGKRNGKGKGAKEDDYGHCFRQYTIISKWV